MRAVYNVLFVLLICGLSLATYFVAFERFERAQTQISTERLSLYRAGLSSTLQRVAHLPRVVNLHPNTREVLRQGKSIAGYNRYLKSVNDQAGSAALYLLDRNGMTIAASNFDTEESFIGNNYFFRKYYTDAIKNGTAQFFAVGVTTGRPGYFLSEAITFNGELLGVAVVKVEFIELLQSWEEAREDVLISNTDGVVVLASNPERLYKTLYEISPDRQSEMIKSRKFAQYQLEPLVYESKTGDFDGRVAIDGKAFSLSMIRINDIGWNLHFLTPLGSVHNSALALAAVTFLLGGLTAIGFLYARSKVERTRLQIIAKEAERVREANVQLEREISERKRTEERLRETQAELIQSSRLAALGKMSAAIVHEVNQPVSAIRTYTSSGQLLLGKRRMKDASEVFSQIAKMTERLGAITSDLLVFSRKPIVKPQEIDLNNCVHSIVGERMPVIKEANVELILDLWTRPLHVKGSEHRFEQLIANLLQNAIQACTPDEEEAEGFGRNEGGEDGGNEDIHIATPALSTMEKSTVMITTIADPQSAILMVSDNGTGIKPEIMDQLFDPFYTTKGVGKGVGLGLALCYAIVDEAEGRIRCENREEGGARFIVELPLSETAKQPFDFEVSADG